MCVCITNRVPSDDLYLSDNQSGVSSGIYSTQMTNIHKIVGNIHVRRGWVVVTCYPNPTPITMDDKNPVFGNLLRWYTHH